jgi:uncharacterized protein YlxW (UPF0749 family)
MRQVWRLAVVVVFAAAGGMFAVSAKTAAGTDLRADQRTSLADLIRSQEHKLATAQRRVNRLTAEVDAGTSGVAGSDRRVAAARAQAQTFGAAVGLGAVRGPALTVTLDDAPRAADRLLPSGTSPDDLVVHQQDVQSVVNALWAGGAEAMQIMDQRVISTSAVRCVGNTLVLQGRVYSPPYVVTAIGDPQRLREALDASPEVQLFRQYVTLVGLGYETKEHQSVRLPGYTGPLDLQHATVAP